VGQQVFDDASGGEVLVVSLVLFEAFLSLAAIVGFLFFRMVSRLVTPLFLRSGGVCVVVCR
jgi:hypothetical protein